jgi:hypothetical protein
VFTFKTKNVFDQPQATRQLLGFMGYLNDFSRTPVETMNVFTSSLEERVFMFFNCHNESIKDLMHQTREGTDTAQVSFA